VNVRGSHSKLGRGQQRRRTGGKQTRLPNHLFLDLKQNSWQIEPFGSCR